MQFNSVQFFISDIGGPYTQVQKLLEAVQGSPPVLTYTTIYNLLLKDSVSNVIDTSFEFINILPS